jgi:hypothetical protein
MSININTNDETKPEIVLEIEQTVIPEKKVITNIWKQRSEEAAKIVKPIEIKPEVKQTLPTDKIPDSGGKGQGKGYKKYESNEGGKGKGKGYKKYESNEGGKGRGKGYKSTTQTPEEKLYYENKSIAFDKAQAIAIKKCVDRCNLKMRDDINNSISHELNYKRTLVIDITDDTIMVEVENNTYEYSFRRFLENRHFQNNLREEYSKILPQAWVNFRWRDEGTFCIGIQKHKNI